MTTNLRPLLILFVMCIGMLFFPLPCLAGVEYPGGEPVLSVSLKGQNEYLPGSDAVLVVVIENRGVHDYKLLPQGRSAAEEVPSTAKLLRVGLGAGEAPLVIRTDPQMVGDLRANAKVEVPFDVKFMQDAPGGNYTLPVSLSYSSLRFAEQSGSETMVYTYTMTNTTALLPVKVTPRASIGVAGIEPGELTAGNEGYLDLSIMNTGSLSVHDAVARVVRHQESPLVPVAGSSFIGDFAAGSITRARFKVKVGDQAQNASYPLDVVVEYPDSEGDLVTSHPVTIGVPVQGAVGFEVISGEFAIPRGGSRDVAITFKNTGPVMVRSAQARIVAVDPFSASKDTASLGDLKPGEEATVTFSLSVDKAATVKEYGLESEVRYRDALDNRLVSDPMKVRVRVTNRSGADMILSNPLILSIIGAVVIGMAYLVYTRRKKDTGNAP